MSSRLFAVGIGGPVLSEDERQILSGRPPWGVILFRRNIESVDQLSRLIAELRECRVEHFLLDQEGGPVDRLRDLLGPSPSFRAATEANRAREAGELAGAALAHFGFDVDLAPVVDRACAGAGALVLGDRSASADAREVVRAADQFLDGLHARGVGGCLKHFPGLGRARLDTHQALPVVAPNPHEDAIDLAPFDALMGKAGAIMIAHAAGADGIPASLSYGRATGLLRDVLDFAGAAFSDDLEMGALAAYGDLPARAAAAARAGCDLLLVCRRIDAYPACVDAVEESIPVPRRAEAAERLAEYATRLAAVRAPATAAVESLAAIDARRRAFDVTA